MDEANVETARRELEARLRDALEFARRQKTGQSGSLKEALRLLHAKKLKTPYYHDALPPVGYSLGARQLIAAAAQAWVFGGMGSWSDTWFEDQADERKLHSLANALLNAILRGCAAATNHFEWQPSMSNHLGRQGE